MIKKMLLSHKGCRCFFLIGIAAILTIASCTKRAGNIRRPDVINLTNEHDDYRVLFETSKGTVVIEAHSSWAPNGANRFRELTESGYYNGCKFYRVIKGFMVQAGLNGDPPLTAQWTGRQIDDDPPRAENMRGTVCMARSGPNSATTQFFINTNDNLFLESQGCAPFGSVVEGMEIVDSLYSEYGECAPIAKGPEQRWVIAKGDVYLSAEFPLLDRIITATLQQKQQE
jgi:peptidyl-prolyl cis-trans isomerase A (cyclophilin A)